MLLIKTLRRERNLGFAVTDIVPESYRFPVHTSLSLQDLQLLKFTGYHMVFRSFFSVKISLC